MYGCKPFNNTQICVKEVVNGFEISIAFDDSCGAFHNLTRGDIRVYCVSDDSDITESISQHTITASIENLIMVNEWCKSH